MKAKQYTVNKNKSDKAGYMHLKSINETSVKVNAEGMVLLENDGMLPLKKDEKIAFFGRMQKIYYKSGTGSGGLVRTPYVTNIYDALKTSGYIQLDTELEQIYDAWTEDNPFDYGDGWTQPWAQNEMPLSDEIVKEAAKRNDKALVVIGRTAGEDRDNSANKGSYLLSDAEYDMLRKVSDFFDEVCVKVSGKSYFEMHIDTDEANAFNLKNNDEVEIIC